MIGHLLFSMWHRVDPNNRTSPEVGVRGGGRLALQDPPVLRRLDRLLPRRGRRRVRAAGRTGTRRRAAIAAGRRDPIEKLFGIASDVAPVVRRPRPRVVATWTSCCARTRSAGWPPSRRIREGKDARAGLPEGLGMTPDEFDKRWADRLLGKRKTMADVPKDARSPTTDGPGGAARRRITQEQDPPTLAALIRGLDHVRRREDRRAGPLAPEHRLRPRPRDDRRACSRGRTRPEVVAWLRTTGLADPRPAGPRPRRPRPREPEGRACPPVARGAARRRPLARAGERRARPRRRSPTPRPPPSLVAQVDDANPKAWISKADALAKLRRRDVQGDARDGRRTLAAPDWQVRLTACRALGDHGRQGRRRAPDRAPRHRGRAPAQGDPRGAARR